MQVDEFIPHIEGVDFFIKPNVRKMFVPDVGYTMFDVDLKQADVWTVAWEAEDETLKEIFRGVCAGDIDLHEQNAKDIYGLPHKPSGHQRQMAKHGVHATDFGSSARTMAKKLDMTVHQADAFQKRWFMLHPAIRKWHRRVENDLMTTRSVKNAFGYRRIFFDRIDSVLPEALAWVPQSTTVNIIDKGMNNLDEYLPEVQLLLQVHDSAVGQFLNYLYKTIRETIQTHMLITVPYDDPLTIPVEIACSRKSWGDCEKVPFNDGVELCPH